MVGFTIPRMIHLSEKSSLWKQGNFKYPSRFSVETMKEKKKTEQANKDKTSNKTNNQKLALRRKKKTRIKQTKTQTDFCARHSLNGNKIIKRNLLYRGIEVF